MTTKRNAADTPNLDGSPRRASDAELQPLWEVEGPVSAQPLSRAVPFRWRLTEMEKFGARATDLYPRQSAR